jgi:hypothetical protein
VSLRGGAVRGQHLECDPVASLARRSGNAIPERQVGDRRWGRTEAHPPAILSGGGEEARRDAGRNFVTSWPDTASRPASRLYGGLSCAGTLSTSVQKIPSLGPYRRARQTHGWRGGGAHGASAPALR